MARFSVPNVTERRSRLLHKGCGATGKRLTLIPQLRRIYLSVFFASVGLSSVYLIPAFAESLGANYLQLGYIGTTRAIPYMFLPIIFGYLGDRFNRRRLYLSSILLTGVGTLLLAFTNTFEGILSTQLILGVGFSSFWPLSEALVSEAAPSGKQTGAMGKYGVAWASGFLMGPLVSGYLAGTAGFRTMFLIAGMTVLVTAAVSTAAVRGSQTKQVEETRTDNLPRRGLLSELAPILWIQLPYGLVFSFIITILPGYALTSGLTPLEVGVVLSAFGVARAGTFSLSGRFGGLGERRSIILASGGIVFALLVMPLSLTFVGLLIDILLLGFFIGILYPQVVGYICKHTPPANLGFSMGLYEATVGIGFAVGPITSGFIAQTAGMSTTCFVLSAAAFSMIPIMAFPRTERRD